MNIKNQDLVQVIFLDIEQIKIKAAMSMHFQLKCFLDLLYRRTYDRSASPVYFCFLLTCISDVDVFNTKRIGFYQAESVIFANLNHTGWNNTLTLFP